MLDFNDQGVLQNVHYLNQKDAMNVPIVVHDALARNRGRILPAASWEYRQVLARPHAKPGAERRRPRRPVICASGGTGYPAANATEAQAVAEITILASDGSGHFSAYLLEPRDKPAGAVVLIQEIFGVN